FRHGHMSDRLCNLMRRIIVHGRWVTRRGDAMGLLKWLDRRLDDGNVKLARKTLHGLAMTVDTDPAYAAAVAAHLSAQMDQTCPPKGQSAREYVYHLRRTLVMLPADELLDGGHAILKQADRLRPTSPARAQAMALLAKWAAMMSMAKDAAAPAL